MSDPIGGSRPQHPLTRDQQGLDRQPRPAPTVPAMALQVWHGARSAERPSPLTHEQLAQIQDLQDHYEIFSRRNNSILDRINSIIRSPSPSRGIPVFAASSDGLMPVHALSSDGLMHLVPYRRHKYPLRSGPIGRHPVLKALALSHSPKELLATLTQTVREIGSSEWFRKNSDLYTAGLRSLEEVLQKFKENGDVKEMIDALDELLTDPVTLDPMKQPLLLIGKEVGPVVRNSLDASSFNRMPKQDQNPMNRADIVAVRPNLLLEEVIRIRNTMVNNLYPAT